MSRRNNGRDRRLAAPSRSSVLFDASPYYAAGIKLDLDAAAANVTKDGSNRISQWSDKSGNGYHAVQGTAAQQPLWIASATPRGMPAVQLDDTARNIVKAAGYLAASATGYTWFGVVKLLNPAGVSGFLHSSGAAGLRPMSRPNTAQTTYGVEFDSSTRITASAYDSNHHVVCLRLAASGGSGTVLTTAECYVDNVSVAVSGTPNFTTGPASYQLGANGSSRVGSEWARILEAPATLLSVSDCQAISAGLMAMYL